MWVVAFELGLLEQAHHGCSAVTCLQRSGE
jgi:hypothetical protein